MKKEGELTFGEFFQILRQEKGLTLRDFCKKAGADPANISRMERGAMSPPKGREILDRYAVVLGLLEGTDDWYKFFDMAHIESGRIPEELLEDEAVAASLPILFRTLRGKKISEKKLDELVQLIRKA